MIMFLVHEFPPWLAGSIPEELGALSELRELYLNRNRLTGILISGGRATKSSSSVSCSIEHITCHRIESVL